MFEDLTIGTCSYNTPDYIENLFKSFLEHHKELPELLVIENSTNEDTVEILNKHNIPFIRNEGGTHSRSVDLLIENCKTKYLLLVDTDILFKAPIDAIVKHLPSYDVALFGELTIDRGDFNLHPRINPWFCFIDVEQITTEEIKFHDQERIDRTSSNGFYNNIPLCEKSDQMMYDVGATFYEDCNNTGLFIQNSSIVRSFFVHYEGGSWYTKCDEEHFNLVGKEMQKHYKRDSKHLKNKKLKYR